MRFRLLAALASPGLAAEAAAAKDVDDEDEDDDDEEEEEEEEEEASSLPPAACPISEAGGNARLIPSFFKSKWSLRWLRQSPSRYARCGQFSIEHFKGRPAAAAAAAAEVADDDDADAAPAPAAAAAATTPVEDEDEDEDDEEVEEEEDKAGAGAEVAFREANEGSGPSRESSSSWRRRNSYSRSLRCDSRSARSLPPRVWRRKAATEFRRGEFIRMAASSSSAGRLNAVARAGAAAAG